MDDPNIRSDVTLSTVYKNGVKARDVMYFADLNGELILGDRSPLDYGYVSRQFKIEDIDWNSNQIVYNGQHEVAVPLLILDADGPGLLKAV